MLEMTKHKDIDIAQETCYVGENETRVFVYNVDGLLVDTGPESRAEVYTNWFKTQAIRQVALTHNHEDHSGNAAWVRENLNVPVYLHPGSLSYAKENGAYPEYRHVMWGDRHPFDALPMPEWIETEKYKFQTLDTPGHAIYHNCFYEPNEGWLFTGDLYLGTHMLVCFFEENMRQTVDTIERLMKLEFDTIFCAHAGVIENGKVRLGKKLNNLKQLQGQVLEMRAKGMTDREIDAELGFEMDITSISGGEWSSYNIMRTI